MPNQVTDKSAVTEQNRVGEVEMALPSSASPSDMLLSRIAILLFILVAGLLTVFGYYASSICITVVLAGFTRRPIGAFMPANQSHSHLH